MLPVESLVPYALTVLILAVVPGPDHAYLAAVAVRDGARAGAVAATGMAASMTVHTLVAVTGLGTMLSTFPGAMTAIRLIGAGYLVLLGMTAMRARESDHEAVVPSGRVFTRAAIVNLTNPKIVLFFLAFLPQFVSPASGAVAVQLLVLGLTFVALGFVVDLAYAALFARAGRTLVARGANGRLVGTISGTVLLGLAAFVIVDTLRSAGPAA